MIRCHCARSSLVEEVDVSGVLVSEIQVCVELLCMDWGLVAYGVNQLGVRICQYVDFLGADQTGLLQFLDLFVGFSVLVC